MAADRFDVDIAFEADGDPNVTAQALIDTLVDSTAPVARIHAVSTNDSDVVVHFREIADEVPVSGSDYRPPRRDEPTEQAGREAIERLADMHEDSTALTPIVRALVAMSAARARAGLSARQRITISVTPAPTHQQTELRHT